MHKCKSEMIHLQVRMNPKWNNDLSPNAYTNPEFRQWFISECAWTLTWNNDLSPSAHMSPWVQQNPVTKFASVIPDTSNDAMERIRHSLIHADVTYMITQTTVIVVNPSSGGPSLIYSTWYVDINDILVQVYRSANWSLTHPLSVSS